MSPKVLGFGSRQFNRQSAVNIYRLHIDRWNASTQQNKSSESLF
ncbi:hypothetical protein [Lawsonia intracellularis]|nr:hypothetical protein [Lawsonia intracellularis]